MAQWFTGKGYGVSSVTDVTGRPLLTYQGPGDPRPFLLADRVAQTFDFTVPQILAAGAMKNDRMDSAVASAAKKLLGGVTDDELDHKISLELGGANTPANLWIQHGMSSGASASSDTLENNLALDVVAGRISLLQAWRTLEDQKGFLLAEDIVTSKRVDIVGLMLTLSGNLKDYITGSRRAQLGTGSASLKQTMNQLLSDLAKTPTDQVKLETLIATQTQLNMQTLNVSSQDAARVTKSAIAAYAESKGVDPREIIGATNKNIQRIISNSNATPNIYGVSTTALAAIMTAAAAVLSTVGIVAFAVAIIGVIMVGPEAIAGALSGGLFESIGGLIGVSPTVGISFATVAITEGTAAMMFLVGQGIKSIYDAGYLLPTQNITAMKDALAIQKGLAGFLPSMQQPGATGSSSKSRAGSAAAPTPQPQYTPTGGEGSVDGSWTFHNGAWIPTLKPTAIAAAAAAAPSSGPPQLFIGHIDSGNLRAVAPYSPAAPITIASADDMASAAQAQIAAFLAGLPAALVYEIKTKTRIVNSDGTESIGTIHRVQKGTTTKGKPTYHNVTDKFAVAEIFVLTPQGKRSRVEEILLGPVDETRYRPTQQQLVDLSNQISGKLVTSSLQSVTSVTLSAPTTPPETQPAPTPAPTPAPAPTPTPAPTPSPTPAPAQPSAQPAPNFSSSTQGPIYVPPSGQVQPIAPVSAPAGAFPGADNGGTMRVYGPDVARAIAAGYSVVGQISDAGSSWPSAIITKAAAAPAAASRTVTVNVATLHVRSAPNTTAPLAGSMNLVMGNQFVVTGWVHGESVSGEDRWWISSRGNYVWVGGTQEKP